PLASSTHRSTPLRTPPYPTLFPYTTLFRSLPAQSAAQGIRQRRRIARRDAGARHPREPGGLFRLVSCVPLLSRLHRSGFGVRRIDRKSTRLNSSHVSISYAVFCLKKKTYA